MPKGKQWLWIAGVMGATVVALIVIGLLLPEDEDDTQAETAPVATRQAPTATVVPTATGCSSDDASAALDAIRPIITEFDDAFDRASATARIALSEPIGAMQAARRSLESTDLPDCADALKRILISAYNDQIDAFLAFQSQDTDAATLKLQSGEAKIRAATELVNDLQLDQLQ